MTSLHNDFSSLPMYGIQDHVYNQPPLHNTHSKFICTVYWYYKDCRRQWNEINWAGKPLPCRVCLHSL